MKKMSGSEEKVIFKAAAVILIICLAMSCFTGCKTPDKSPGVEALSRPSADVYTGEVSRARETLVLPEYRIGEQDILKISVWQEDDLNQEVMVRPDGRISFPLAGDIIAAGLTFPQLRGEISKKLKEYLKYPVVNVGLKEMGGKKVTILGEVRKPGVYDISGKSTVLEGVARALGFTEHAVKSSVILIRGSHSNPVGVRLDLEGATTNSDLSQNTVLKPHDIVYVPKNFIANVNYVVGQIVGPLSGAVNGLENVIYLEYPRYNSSVNSESSE